VTERMFGVETEFAFALFGAGGQRLSQEGAVRQLMEHAARRLPHLPSRGGSGLWMSNGSRLSIDCLKPEIATPECTHPSDACRYVKAGQRTLAALAQQLVGQYPEVCDALVSTVNVSYGSVPTTWAGHESYGHRTDPELLPPQLISHLVTRQIYTGAGGFDNRSPGLIFLITPRVAHLVSEISGESTRDRGIFHTKDESLSSSGYHRLHVLCGESNCSETSLWLKMATTALTVALIEAGKKPGEAVQLRHPLQAMQDFARDVTLKATALTISGRRMTALEIQRHYLSQFRRYQNASFMPGWASEACDLLERVLDRLSEGPAAVQTTLDWAIKLALFRARAQRQRIAWESLGCWNMVLQHLHAFFETQRAPESPVTVITCDVLATDNPAAAQVEMLTPLLAREGLSWDGLEGFLRLRQELCEIDMRFGQLTGAGIFSALEQAGVLDHHVAGVEGIDLAESQPPQVGRARLRGECVGRFANRRDRYACDWGGVWDLEGRMVLDLADPFTSEEDWRELVEPPDAGRDPFVHLVRRALDDALRLYDQGAYDAAYERIRSLDGPLRRCDARMREEFHVRMAWIRARRGDVDAVNSLEAFTQAEPMTLAAVCDFACVYRFQGLASNEQIQPWIERGRALLAEEPRRQPGAAAAFLEHEGYTLLRQGKPALALESLREAAVDFRFRAAHVRVQARTLADQADAHRMLGQLAEADALLDHAERLQMENGFEGDLADFTHTYRAKLLAATDPAAARSKLRAARQIQNRLAIRIGEARSMLLEARMGAKTSGFTKKFYAARFHKRLILLRDSCLALAQCPMFKRILDHWDVWTTGEMLSGEADFFWRI
jgi:proteasome accessory factor A